MPHPRHLRIVDYTYELPDERIARRPLANRARSRLLIYKESRISEDTYANMDAHVPEGMLMVFNETKVVRARLMLQKQTGGQIEVFCLEPDGRYADVQTAMLQKGRVYWQCLVGGAAKWKQGIVPELHVPGHDFTLRAHIAKKHEGYFTLLLEWDNVEMSFAEVLHHAGQVPLPPYMNRAAEVADVERYQTVYARQEGSVAAPTAGLHFTPKVLEKLNKKRVDTDFVTLHVGAGTFKPVKSDTMETHDMHAEWILVSQPFVENLIAHLPKGVVAVGTTSLRTLESLYWLGAKLLRGDAIAWQGVAISQWDAYEMDALPGPAEALQALLQYMRSQELSTLTTRTQILIAPGYDFKIVGGLVTNFHQPQSTLLLLVAALIGEDWRKVYNHALANDFRFLSYGDGSLLWRKA